MSGMGKRQQVQITITVSGELDPTSVKAQAFSHMLSAQPVGDEEIPREATEHAASLVAGSLKSSAQILVMELRIPRLLEEALPSFKARQGGGFSVVVDAPGLGPEDGGNAIIGWPA
jgi:hypothetical protein